MIQILRKDDILLITGESRNENELEETQLLYSYPDLYYTQELINNLRPYKDLTKKQECYKISLLSFLPDILYENYIPEKIGEIEVTGIIQETENIIKLLGYQKKQELDKPQIIYTCDIWNYLEDLYGEKVILVVKEFRELKPEDKDFLKKLYILPSYQKKFKMVSEYEGINRVYNFLPPSIQENLIIFGTTLSKVGKENSIPEFRNKSEILPPPPDLRTEIYKEFEVGEVFWEGADNVKERLQKIYDLCEIPKISKMIDLSEYFEFTKQWIDGKRYVRHSYRKQ